MLRRRILVNSLPVIENPREPIWVHDDLSWTAWIPLREAFEHAVLPTKPALDRIRRAGRRDLDYIGQTGAGLRGRVRQLRGIDRVPMPYRDPHTAGPALWALLQSEDAVFEVSVCPVAGGDPWRKALEAIAIAGYRQ